MALTHVAALKDETKPIRNEGEPCDLQELSRRLAGLRARRRLSQSDLRAFTQTAVSKLERRTDMKLSTLLEYLDCIGLGMEIRVYPKTNGRRGRAETLLRT